MSTYGDLFTQEETDKSKDNLNKLLKRSRNTSFEEFWDILGRPWKHGRQLGVLPYQKDLVETLEQTKYLLLTKSVGCGGTEFFIRWILWQLMRNDDWANSQTVIIVSPSQQLANRIITRFKDELEPHGILFDTARTYLNLPGKKEIFSIPAMNLNSMRSLTNLKCVLISEADFIGQENAAVARQVSERYISKSDNYIILESTINSPVGLYSDIWKENPCLYTRKVVKYLDAIDMYLEKDIQKAKQSRSFAREMMCDLYGLSNVISTFPPQWVERAFTMNEEINPTKYYLACDPGWRPALTGISLLGKDERTGLHKIIVSEEYDEDESSIIELIVSLKEQFSISNIFIDANDKRLISKIKGACTRDRTDWEEHIKFLKQNKILNAYNPLKNLMTVVPLLFNQASSREMTSYTRSCLEEGTVQIPSVCKSLERALYNCQDIEGDIIKEKLAHGNGSDVLDSLRMVLWGASN